MRDGPEPSCFRLRPRCYEFRLHLLGNRNYLLFKGVTRGPGVFNEAFVLHSSDTNQESESRFESVQ
jgi:hypothetical protein